MTETIREALTAMNEDPHDEGVTLTEYARQCREICGHDAQSSDGRKCGESADHDGAPAFSFCGFHWGPVLDADDF